MAAFCLCALALLLASGCVERRITVDSTPRGARLFLDDRPYGETPSTIRFVYYGTSRVRLEKEGYERKIVMQDVPAPWYQWPPMDFFVEILCPFTVRDTRYFHYELEPAKSVTKEELIERAKELRERALTPPTD